MITVENIEELNLPLLANSLLKVDYNDALEIVVNSTNSFYRIYPTQDGWMYDIANLDDVSEFIVDGSIEPDIFDDLDIVDGGAFDTEKFNFESAHKCLKFIFLN